MSLGVWKEPLSLPHLLSRSKTEETAQGGTEPGAGGGNELTRASPPSRRPVRLFAGWDLGDRLDF